MSIERFWQTVLVNCEALPREVLPAAAEAAGKPVLGTCVVIDLSGFGYVLSVPSLCYVYPGRSCVVRDVTASGSSGT